MALIRENDKLTITSPLRKGDLIHSSDGQLHQIIHWSSQPTMTYRTRNLETGHLETVSITVEDDNMDKSSLKEEVVGEGWYCEITGLQCPKNEVTLKLWGTDNDVKVKVWDEDDLKVIQDGLMRGDQQVFCKLVKIMGKLVLGDIKTLPKDPLIVNMPDLVMDKIFSNLSLEDRLSCRLVTRSWGFHHLNLQRILKCTALMIGSSGTKGYFRSYPCDGKGLIEYEVNIKDLHPFCQNSLLSGVEDLRVHTDGKQLEECEPNFVGILEHVTSLKSFHLHCGSNPYSDPEIWPFIKKFVGANQGTLKTLRICTFAEEEGPLDMESLVGGCTSLETLELSLGYGSYLATLDSLPPSIKHLTLVGLSVPLTMSQCNWVVTNLSNNLQRLVLLVEYDNGEENVLGGLRCQGLPNLVGVSLLFDFPIPGELGGEGGVELLNRGFTLRQHIQDLGAMLESCLAEDEGLRNKWNVSTSFDILFYDIPQLRRFLQELQIVMRGGYEEGGYKVLDHKESGHDWLKR